MRNNLLVANHYSKERFADARRPNSLIRSLINNPSVFFEELTGEYYTYVNIYKKSQLIRARAYLNHESLNKEAFDKTDYKWIVAPEYLLTVEEAGL